MNPRNYLKGNAMFLPIHWIYDREYLKEVIIHRDIFNLAYQSNDYKRAKTSYDVYKNQVQGDTTTQGVIFKRLLDIYERQHTLTRKDYEDVLKDMFLIPNYTGYQESFIKHYISHIKGEMDMILEDDHTVYMLPYLILKDMDKASLLSQVFNERLTYQKDMILLDFIVKHIHQLGFKETYDQGLKTLDVPSYYHDVVRDCDLGTFVDTYAGMSCSIKFAMPVIYHLMYRYPLKEALYHNFLVGGSIAERAGFICYVLGSLHIYEKDVLALKP